MQLGDLLLRVDSLPIIESIRRTVLGPAQPGAAAPQSPITSSQLPALTVLEAAKPVTIAAVGRRLARPMIVLVPRPEQARSWADQIAIWLGEGVDVLLFPEPDALPYEPLPSDPTTVQLRLRVLAALADEQPAIVVACGQALMQRTFGAAQLRSAVHRLRRGQRINLTKLLARWVDLGYRAEPVVDVPGTFSRRGGILDIFPPTSDAPVRIDLFGDEIDDMRTFDPVTQRSTEQVEAIAIGPAREGDDEGAQSALPLQGCLLDYLPEAGVLVVDEPETLEAVVMELEDQADELRAGRIARGELPANAPEPHFRWADLIERLARRRRIDLRYAESLIDEGDTPPPGPLPDAERGRSLGAPSELTRSSPLPRAEKASEPPSSSPLPVSGMGRGRGPFREPASFPDLEGQASESSPLPVSGRGRGRGPDTRPEQGTPLPPLPPGEGGGEGGPQSLALGRLPFRPAPLFGGRLRTFVDVLPSLLSAAAEVVVVSQQSARLTELIGQRAGAESALPRSTVLPPNLKIVHGSLAEGWILDRSEADATVLLTDAEIFGVSKPRRIVRRRPVNREAFLADLTPGDLVVHVEHGIGRFAGLVRRGVDGREREYLFLEYAAGDQLYVPVDQVDRVSRYVGGAAEPPALTRLGTQEWTRAKERVRRSVRDIAAELIRLYSARQVAGGHAFSPDTAWQHDMETAFPYVETPDQLAAIEAVKADMEAARPMDRLLCGDVGYGKTEVALRAAFKAVMDGKQVAVLVPTTVLAQQHYRTFSERLAAFPVTVEMLSRFRSEPKVREVLEKLAAGSVDIVVGTHRLVQKDVQFKDLGLVIVDEEQRFGVAHKERLKQLRQEVDVLTLTATPIPRTLHMALAGIRDMSTMDTPPEERLPVKTFVAPSDDRLIREVVLRELDRGGQVYFVHNRVYNIETVAHRLRELVPEARIAVGHGQMPEDLLERVMLQFAEGERDVLVCTTIIESGLDIPNVNTIVVNHADTFGLAQLYQLRGRVGRGASRAYAYLLYEKHRTLTETAEKRLRAIFEASDLGAGFRIAMKDLEIRGTGNLLGAEQSGHIGAVGFDLYMKLLAKAVDELQTAPTDAARKRSGKGAVMTAEAAIVDLPLAASLPASYVADPPTRLNLYRRLAEAETVEAIVDLERELIDRFGELPPSARTLLYVATVRVLATRAFVQSVTLQDGVVTLKLGREVRQYAGLERSIPGVRVGHTQIHIDQRVAAAPPRSTTRTGRRSAPVREAVAAGARSTAVKAAAVGESSPPASPSAPTAPWQEALLTILRSIGEG